jgi:type I restriction enzyme S subunit
MSSKTKTTATKEEATPALVPKLRFPEFRSAAKWDEKAFGELLDDIIDFRGRTPIKLGMDWGNGNITSLSANNVKNGFIDYKAECNLGSEELYQRWMGDVNLEKDDIVFTMEAPLGNALLLPDSRKYILSQRVVAFKTNSEVRNPFLVQLIWSEGFQDAINELATGSTAKGINQKALKTILVAVPRPPEQQKIAECLSSVDDLIAAQARKLDALKTHKKGLMQQLFPREGETQPRLRFPEFQNAGEWEPKSLGDVVKSFKTGKLDANAMVENGQYRFYTCAKNYYQIDDYAFEGEALLVAGNGAHLGYIHHYIGKFNAYQRTYVLQKFKANVIFLRCLLDRYLPARIQFEKKDGNTPYIVLSTLTEMPLVIPRDPDEQQRIADCLTSLDDLIAAQTQKHEVLKTHKKGLMQQLFPSPEEVAG